MIEADIAALDPKNFATVLGSRTWNAFTRSLGSARLGLRGRTVWHINSAITGGGVAELLRSVVGYQVGAGIPTRWAAIEGPPEFFVITKRIHHMLHGQSGDGGSLGDREHDVYQSTLAEQWSELTDRVDEGDVVVLHDPQVAGLVPAIREVGAHVIWNSHVGADEESDLTRRAWDFLLPDVSKAEAQVFSRRQYIWKGLEPERTAVIPPCIDAFSPKNQDMEPTAVQSILSAAGIVDSSPQGQPTFLRQDGSVGRVRTTAHMTDGGQVPPDVPVVTQVSRWDPLKDHLGLALAFGRGDPSGGSDGHLVLAGPDPTGVTDDPEGQATFDALREGIASLSESARRRIHIACLPMSDPEENAAVVNALQRHSRIVVQKSLAEGFGLTVTEAMWKGRPTVASAVGGIQDQISDDVNGVLVEDPEDLDGFSQAISALLVDDERARRLGDAARRTVVEEHLTPSYLISYLSLFERILRD